MNNKRFYSFNLVIYEDDERFTFQFEELNNLQESIWIRHDKDLKEDSEEGELKKPHYHFVIRLKNASTISALAKRLNVDEHMIEPIKRSFNGSLKYLIHYGYDNKYQYSSDEVRSNSDRLYRKFLDLIRKEEPEVDKVESIEEFIVNTNDYIDWVILGRYVRKKNLWDAFRRNMSYFTKVVDSHNAKISAIRYHAQGEYWKGERLDV